MIKARTLSRRAVFAAAGGLAAPWVIGSARSGAVIRIGHLTDVSGSYSANSGAVSIACARQALEDFALVSKGITVDYLVGDHQNSPDIAMNIVREWFDRGDVDAVLEVNNSAIALALNTLCTQKDKVHLNHAMISREADLSSSRKSP